MSIPSFGLEARGPGRMHEDRHRASPPRGVPKSRFSKDDWYDVWFPTLAPSLAAAVMLLPN